MLCIKLAYATVLSDQMTLAASLPGSGLIMITPSMRKQATQGVSKVFPSRTVFSLPVPAETF